MSTATEDLEAQAAPLRHAPLAWLVLFPASAPELLARRSVHDVTVAQQVNTRLTALVHVWIVMLDLTPQAAPLLARRANPESRQGSPPQSAYLANSGSMRLLARPLASIAREAHFL